LHVGGMREGSPFFPAHCPLNPPHKRYIPPVIDNMIFEKIDLMKNRKYYRSRFADYPDVLTIPLFCKMMGGICDKTARKLINENHVKYLHVRNAYLIPKEWAIDYILSTHYAKYRPMLKGKV